MAQAYTKVFEEIRRRILNGDFVPGQKLPAERELCEDFGVSRITVRHAMSLLQQRGMVERFAGKGTFVRSAKAKKLPIVGGDFIGSMQANVPALSRKVCYMKTEVPPVEVSQAFGLIRSQECFVSMRVDLDGETPLAFDIVYIPVEYSKSITEDMLRQIDFLNEWLGCEGLAQSHFVESIEAATADASQAQTLDVPEGSAILYSLDKAFSDDGKVIAVFESYYRGDKIKLVSTSKSRENKKTSRI